MSVLTVLYESYRKCEQEGLVDNHDNKNETILLPLFHTNLKSNGSNIIKIVINKNSEFVNSMLLSEDEVIIFPVTEDSITRTSGASPHPISDQMSYLSNELNKIRYDMYITELTNWINFCEGSRVCDFLKTILNYLIETDLVTDVAKGITGGLEYTIDDKNNLVYEDIDKNGNRKKFSIDLTKIFITFEIVEFIGYKNYSISNYIELHNNYIDYQKLQNSEKKQSYCNISGKKMYCVNKHRGIMGNSKLIGVSNNDETYLGRFSSGDQIIAIGYETSQRIHNMIKYLLENKQTSKWLGESSYLVTFFSDDISNSEKNIDVTLINDDSLDEIFPLDEDQHFEDSIKSDFKVGTVFTESVGKSVYGEKLKKFNTEKAYVMIMEKSSPGRVAIKYFRELNQSEFYENLHKWNKSVRWEFYNRNEGKFNIRTPSIFEIVDYAFGIERDKKIVFDNKKYRASLIEKMIPSVIEGRRISRDFVLKLFTNAIYRNRYKEKWLELLNISCAIIAKYKQDYYSIEVHKEGEIIMIEENKQSRSYIYGRILSVLEQTELATYKDYKSPRPTNAQRLWSVYTKAPAKIMMQLKEKLQPYEQRLLKSEEYIGRYVFLQKEFTNLMVLLEKTPDYYSKKNKPLNEDFILGYYLQKSKMINKTETTEQN